MPPASPTDKTQYCYRPIVLATTASAQTRGPDNYIGFDNNARPTVPASGRNESARQSHPAPTPLSATARPQPQPGDNFFAAKIPVYPDTLHKNRPNVVPVPQDIFRPGRFPATTDAIPYSHLHDCTLQSNGQASAISARGQLSSGWLLPGQSTKLQRRFRVPRHRCIPVQDLYTYIRIILSL